MRIEHITDNYEHQNAFYKTEASLNVSTEIQLYQKLSPATDWNGA